MQFMLFSFHDLQAKSFAAPISARTYGEAERILKTIATDPSTQVCAHPTDFHLYHIATVDDATGETVPQCPIKLIGKAIDFSDKQPVQLPVDFPSKKARK